MSPQVRALGSIAVLVLPLSSVLSSGCSALGLDQFAQAECLSDSDCNRPPALPATGDDCRTWQCNRTTRHCEVAVLDADEDEAPAMLSPSMRTCAMDGTVDCNDAVASIRPGATEMCNGIDDDCDGVRDDGVAAALLNRPLSTMGDPSQAIVGRGVGGDDADLVALFRVATPATTDPSVLVTRASGMLEEAVLSPVQLDRMGTPPSTVDLGQGPQAIERVGGVWAVLFGTSGMGCSRLSLAVVDPAMRRFGTTADSITGLPTTGACNAASRASLAADRAGGGRLLAAYSNPARAECDAVVPSTVFVTGATVSATDIDIDAAPVVELGTSTDWLAPAMLAVAPAVFVIAFPTAAGIEVHRFDATARTSMLLYTETVTGASGVGLSAGEGTEVALTWAMGCGRDPAEVRFLTLAAGGASATMGARGPLGLDGLQISAAYQPALEEWGFAVHDAERWSLVRTTDNGMLVGPPVEVHALPTDVRPIVRARATGGAFEVIAAEAGRDTPLGVVHADTVACLP